MNTPNPQELSCIIPAYNEDEDVKKIIRSLLESRHVKEVILVDDYSEDEYAQIYRSIEGITLIRHEKNQGKSQAVLTGILASTGNYILVLDADLLWLSAHHIEHLMNEMAQYEIFCLTRGADSNFGKFIGSTYITRGEHLFTRTFFNQYRSQLFDGTRWGFDNNINSVLFTNPVKFRVCELIGVDHKTKEEKYNFFVGTWLDMKMFYEVVIKKYKIWGWVTNYYKLYPHIKNRLRISGERV